MLYIIEYECTERDLSVFLKNVNEFRRHGLFVEYCTFPVPEGRRACKDVLDTSYNNYTIFWQSDSTISNITPYCTRQPIGQGRTSMAIHLNGHFTSLRYASSSTTTTDTPVCDINSFPFTIRLRRERVILRNTVHLAARPDMKWRCGLDTSKQLHNLLPVAYYTINGTHEERLACKVSC